MKGCLHVNNDSQLMGAHATNYPPLFSLVAKGLTDKSKFCYCYGVFHALG